MSSRQAAELDHAFERNGWTPQEVKLLSSGDLLANIRQVVLGRAFVTMVSHIIDCDADPYVPDGWSVEEHQKGGIFEWNVSQVELYLAAGQKNGKELEDGKLRKELVGKPVLNANILDYLFAHPYLIPEEWKGKTIFFWGTVYREPNGHLRVSCLYWGGEGWRRYNHVLGRDCNENCPAALRAS